VGLEFEYSHLGSQSTYFVQRSWEPRGASGVKEGIRVLRDGKPLDDVDSELWSDFVRSLVPPGVAQLFFFDGEKIKRLAEEETEALALGESIKALLGLDLVERLQADLDVFVARHAKRSARSETALRLAELGVELDRLRRELSIVEEDSGRAREEIGAIESEVLKVEERLAQSGEGLASRREDLRHEEANLTAELAATEKSARELLDGAAPLLMCPRLSERLVRQLEMERIRAEWEVGRARAAEVLALVRARLAASPAHLDDPTTSWMEETLEAVQEELAVEPEEVRSARILHGLSERDRDAMIHALQAGVPALASRFSLLATKLVTVEGELRHSRTRINRVPDSAELGPIITELSTLQEKQARHALTLTLLTEREAAIQKEVSSCERERARLERAELVSQRASTRLTLAAQARDAASDYLRRLTVAKTAELERQALASFQRLSRKDDFVAGLRINPDTFAVSLYDSRGVVIPKPSLSAGEKQIYAISLLWGMAQVSGRPLPMIIDTPLGRLDAYHRTSLVERYFPEAAHQVIVLSTDTEVDPSHYEALRSKTSRWLRFSREADSWLRVLKARTGVTPNILCRIGFALSLDEPGTPDPTKYPEDSDREINRFTLLGEYDATYVSLLRQRLVEDGGPGEADLDVPFRAHMNRGVMLLAARVKSLPDLIADLARPEAD
jgi:DNA sulfur modification protein DndD